MAVVGKEEDMSRDEECDWALLQRLLSIESPPVALNLVLPAKTISSFAIQLGTQSNLLAVRDLVECMVEGGC